MTKKLTEFNRTFSTNTSHLGDALTQVNVSYQQQTQLLHILHQIQEKDVTSQNVMLLKELVQCSGFIGDLNKYLHHSTEYLEHVRELNRKMDEYENRTQILEKAGHFFHKNEKWLTENFEIANLEAKNALKKFNESMTQALQTMHESLNKQTIDFENVMKRQNDTLSERTDELSKLVRSINDIGNCIKYLKEATTLQNTKLENLAASIEKLAQIKATGTTLNTPQFAMPRRAKLLFLFGGGLVSITCLIHLLPIFWEWILIFWDSMTGLIN
jgi:chromosome segregation ATPase